MKPTMNEIKEYSTYKFLNYFYNVEDVEIISRNSSCRAIIDKGLLRLDVTNEFAADIYKDDNFYYAVIVYFDGVSLYPKICLKTIIKVTKEEYNQNENILPFELGFFPKRNNEI